MLKRRGPRGLFLKLEYTDLKISKQEKLNVWSAHIFTTYDNYDNNEWISFTYFSVVLQLLFSSAFVLFWAVNWEADDIGCLLLSWLLQWDTEPIGLTAPSLSLLWYFSPIFTCADKMLCSKLPLWVAELLIQRTQSCPFWRVLQKHCLLYQHPSRQQLEESNQQFSDGKEKPFEDSEDTNAISQNVLSSGSGSYYLITRLSSSGCCSKIPKHYDLRWSLDFTDRLSKHSFNYNLQWIAGKNCKDKNRSHVKNISKLASFFYARVTDDSRNKKQGESSSLFYDPKNINLFR